MDHSGGIAASLSGRYATALFELARDGKVIDTVEASLGALDRALHEVPDFAALTTSPVVGRDAASAAVAAVGAQLGIDVLTARFLGVLGSNRRLGALAGVIRDFRALTARHRGEVSAEVTTAHPLTDDQLAALRKQLRGRVGRDVAVTTRIDKAILGGLIVKVGSQMIDASIRTRLNTLALAMKG